MPSISLILLEFLNTMAVFLLKTTNETANIADSAKAGYCAICGATKEVSVVNKKAAYKINGLKPSLKYKNAEYSITASATPTKNNQKTIICAP